MAADRGVMTNTAVTSMTSRTAAPAGSSLPAVTAVLVAVSATALGLAALRSPGDSPLGREDGSVAALLLPPATLAWVVTAAGMVGLVAVVGVLALRPRPLERPRQAVTALLAGEVAVLGFGLGSVTSIALAGYLLAMALPILLAVLVIQAVRRYARVRWAAVALVLAFVAWGSETAVLSLDTLGRLGAGLSTGFVTAAPRLLLAALSTAAMASFGLLLAAELGRTDSWRGAGAYVARHRTVCTMVAACCALPYGLVRMTWFTPWPVLGQSEGLTSEIRLWGLLLGGAALLGFVLTVGLLRPWGERFPRWVPRLAGRPVRVAVAAVPGGIVAAVVWTSALPMLWGLTLSDSGSALGVDSTVEKVAMALVFPFWLWGPMLALAVWGYVVHRQDGSVLAG